MCTGNDESPSTISPSAVDSDRFLIRHVSRIREAFSHGGLKVRVSTIAKLARVIYSYLHQPVRKRNAAGEH